MIEILRYFIFFYCFLGVFIAGGLFFKNRSPANLMLALFILCFTIEQIDFLYTTSNVVLQYPAYYLFAYPICFLFGPSLWLHIQFVTNPSSQFRWKHLLHLLPFVLFVGFALSPLLAMSGAERMEYTRSHFLTEMMPLNYLRTGHVTLYGVLMVFSIAKNANYKKKIGVYLTFLTFIYLITAVLQVYLTLFADSYRQFSIYFFLASTIFLIVGFVLYKYPEVLQQLQQLQQKYFTSTIKQTDKARIAKKIKNSRKEEALFLDSALNLTSYCNAIDEKPQYVSQVFSETFATSFTHFVNAIRVERAQIILTNPKMDTLKILAVAFECGFNNSVTFNKAFVRETGVTPGKYRKNRKLLS